MYTENVIGRNIRKYREEKGLSQSDLAKALGHTAKSAISKIENGHAMPRTGKIKQIAAILGVEFSDIMGWKPSQYGRYTVLIRAYEDASEKDRQAVCMILDIPYLDIEKSVNLA